MATHLLGTLYPTAVQSSVKLFPGYPTFLFTLHRFCANVWGHIHDLEPVWRPEDNSRESVLSLCHVDSVVWAWWQAPLSPEPSCLPYFCLPNTFYFCGTRCVKITLCMCLLTVRTPQVKTSHGQLASPGWTAQPIPLLWNCGSSWSFNPIFFSHGTGDNQVHG